MLSRLTYKKHMIRLIEGFFGFHTKMIDWIMTCVNSTSFSINIKGELHGFFKGARELRQGDPISPYLFTLVMEVLTLMLKRNVKEESKFRYHPKCESLEIINLCFADDLIMFSHGDVNSVKTLMSALDEFTLASGLKPSLPKSTAFFSNVKESVRNDILMFMPFETGSLPIKYLGVPLLSTNLLERNCKVLVERISNKVNDWKNKSLSFAGRLQLINAVLSSMLVYWSSVFILPFSITKQIEKIIRGVLWC